MHPKLKPTGGKKLHATYIKKNKPIRESIIRMLKNDPRVVDHAGLSDLYKTPKYGENMVMSTGEDRRDMVVRKRAIEKFLSFIPKPV